MKKENNKTAEDRQLDLIVLPQVGNTMATLCQKNDDGTFTADECYIIEAVDGKNMSIRLVHRDNFSVKEGKIIIFNHNNVWGFIFRDDIINDNNPLTYMEIEI